MTHEPLQGQTDRPHCPWFANALHHPVDPRDFLVGNE